MGYSPVQRSDKDASFSMTTRSCAGKAVKKARMVPIVRSRTDSVFQGSGFQSAIFPFLFPTTPEALRAHVFRTFDQELAKECTEEYREYRVCKLRYYQRLCFSKNLVNLFKWWRDLDLLTGPNLANVNKSLAAKFKILREHAIKGIHIEALKCEAFFQQSEGVQKTCLVFNRSIYAMSDLRAVKVAKYILQHAPSNILLALLTDKNEEGAHENCGTGTPPLIRCSGYYSVVGNSVENKRRDEMRVFLLNALSRMLSSGELDGKKIAEMLCENGQNYLFDICKVMGFMGHVITNGDLTMFKALASLFPNTMQRVFNAFSFHSEDPIYMERYAECNKFLCTLQQQ